jgi:hypothetical protein
MKLGTIIALKADKHSGQTIRELDAYDKTLVAFKALVAAGVAPLAGHPHIELWSSGGRTKTHKFREQPAAPDAAQAAEASTEQPDEPAAQRGRGRR